MLLKMGGKKIIGVAAGISRVCFPLPLHILSQQLLIGRRSLKSLAVIFLVGLNCGTSQLRIPSFTGPHCVQRAAGGFCCNRVTAKYCVILKRSNSWFSLSSVAVKGGHFYTCKL
ncbi:Hypothetical predicted protein [Podarcis lilfordi]|uniref:Uncharacterized protein n=1 Tax=Podarcis lilfordi TaxID=74358 RepID=A0AA35KW50_9SAUR|nr:Hypothetical predicted protein [Podarcis lilfordi]